MVMIVGNFDQNLPKLVGVVDNAAKAVPQKMAAGPVIQEAKSAPAKPMRGFSTLRYSALPRKAGGPVPASKRADGIAQRGKTRGKMR